MQATATYPDGQRVPNLKFTATVRIEGSPEQILSNEGWGNELGDVTMSFQIPPQAKNLAITVRFHMIIDISLLPFQSGHNIQLPCFKSAVNNSINLSCIPVALVLTYQHSGLGLFILYGPYFAGFCRGERPGGNS